LAEMGGGEAHLSHGATLWRDARVSGAEGGGNAVQWRDSKVFDGIFSGALCFRGLRGDGRGLCWRASPRHGTHLRASPVAHGHQDEVVGWPAW
jgi:hypothetical protein